MDVAAERSLDIAQFLHESRSEDCMTDAMDFAALAGKPDIVPYFHQHRAEGCTPDAMDGADDELAILTKILAGQSYSAEHRTIRDPSLATVLWVRLRKGVLAPITLGWNGGGRGVMCACAFMIWLFLETQSIFLFPNRPPALSPSPSRGSSDEFEPPIIHPGDDCAALVHFFERKCTIQRLTKSFLSNAGEADQIRIRSLQAAHTTGSEAVVHAQVNWSTIMQLAQRVDVVMADISPTSIGKQDCCARDAFRRIGGPDSPLPKSLRECRSTR
ncbi:hypothetical protein BDK51DRAFT_37836 [Blyttiomyces helicus]|uniref:Uncharacterized protein n=1 Tax=Blyttiomyces helicus TaxID=388810 RepID=A0A4P9W7I2_9FUNG|nr:hypothetical protein BDK51DRAFT_37836 [Blyttiomyces helicus]|eukprot:RKO86730.1 hypothetical protein BDK51DRAFT_37836 [Blyttiomyces helicus]